MLKFISVLAVRPFKSLMYDFVIDIYSTVAKVYDLLLDLASGNFNIYSFDRLLELSSAIYVLMGIFMLFRVTVSFLNMLIDPDKVNDKQVGAGSIVKRAIISIVMLLLFQPNSFIFRPNDGLLDRLQNGILNDLIPNILSVNVNLESSSLNKLLISDVYADNAKKTIDCAYYQVSEGGALIDDDCYGDTCSAKGTLTIGNVVLLTIGQNKNEVCNGNGKCVTVKKLGVAGYGQGEVGWYAYFNTGDVTDSRGNTYHLSTDLGKFDFQSILHITQNNADTYFATGTCPPSILPLAVAGNGAKFSNKKNSTTSGRWEYSTIDNLTNNMETAISDFLDNNPASSSEDIGDTSGNLEVEKTLSGGLSFAQSVLKSFISQNSLTGGDSSDVDEKLNSLLLSNESNEEVYDLISAKNPKLSMDFFISMLTGIVIIVYLLFVCIDVIVRNFKLILLEVIAPIPAISYLDPKDKIFSQWLKMFVSVYVDLFLKIIVIKIGVSLLKDVFSIKASLTTFQTILYVAAIFVFIKAVPSLINKLFGIDTSASSFKEIGNVMKKGAGMVAGGAIGAGAALGTGVAAFAASKGQGAGNMLLAAGSGVKNLFAGTLRGVGGGYSGNIKGGLSAAQANMRNRQAYSQGVSASALAGSAILGGVGMDYATRMDSQMAEEAGLQKTYEDFANYKSQMDDIAESSDYMKTLRSKVASGQLQMSEDQLKDERKKWIAYQMSNGAGSLSCNGVTASIEKGKQNALVTTFNDAKASYEENSDFQEAYRTQLYRNELNLSPNDPEMSIEQMKEKLHNAGKDASITAIETKYKNGITDFASLSDAEAGSKHAAGVIRNKHTRIKATKEYRQSAAAREINKNNK